MTTAPYVELRVNPTDLRPGDLPKFGEYLGSPSNAIEAALAVTRAAMVDQMKTEVRGIAEPNHYQLLRMADLAWQAVAWKYRKISAPVIADAYIRAYRAADAGDVPMSVIYDLAEKHAEKVGDYFQETSRQALADGFSSMVNQRIPAKVAADRVMDAYGLTPRQMRGYTGSKFYNPVMSAVPRPLKAKVRAYIDRSFTQRTRKLAKQEEHNIDEQAKQFAWMWLQEKGRLNKKAQKMWITANDERVCPVCGPLHGRKVLINEQFKTAEGAFWSPGLHPNCRCVVRLIENKFSKRDDDWEPKLHPRDKVGRFSTRTRTIDVDEEFKRMTQGVTALDRTTADPQLDLKFLDITHHGILPLATARVDKPRPKTYAYVAPTLAPATAATKTPVATVAEPKAKVESKVKAKVEAKVEAKTEAKTETKPQAKLKPLTKTEAAAKTKTGTKRVVVVGDAGTVTELVDEKSYSTVAQASAAAREKITAEVDQMVANLMREGPKFVDAHGNRYELNEQQTRTVAEFMARQAQAHERSVVAGPEREKNVKLPLHVKQAGSDEVHMFGVQYLASHLDVKPSDFTTFEIQTIDASEAQGPGIESDLDPTYGETQGVTGRFKRIGNQEAGRTTGKFGVSTFGTKKRD